LTGAWAAPVVPTYTRGIRTMDLEENIQERTDLVSPSQLSNDCQKPVCASCEALKDRLRKLSYCLAVAQRLSNLEVA